MNFLPADPLFEVVRQRFFRGDPWGLREGLIPDAMRPHHRNAPFGQTTKGTRQSDGHMDATQATASGSARRKTELSWTKEVIKDF